MNSDQSEEYLYDAQHPHVEVRSASGELLGLLPMSLKALSRQHLRCPVEPPLPVGPLDFESPAALVNFETVDLRISRFHIGPTVYPVCEVANEAALKLRNVRGFRPWRELSTIGLPEFPGGEALAFFLLLKRARAT